MVVEVVVGEREEALLEESPKLRDHVDIDTVEWVFFGFSRL